MEGDRAGKTKGVFDGTGSFLASHGVGCTGLQSDHSRETYQKAAEGISLF